MMSPSGKRRFPHSGIPRAKETFNRSLPPTTLKAQQNPSNHRLTSVTMTDVEFDVPDFELVDIRYELSLLEEHLESVEKQVEAKKEESRQTMNERLRSLDLDPDDSDFKAEHAIARQQHRHRVDDLLPSIFIHPFVVATWSAYESGAKQMTSRFADLLSIDRALSEEDEKHFCDRVGNFLSRIDIEPGYSHDLQVGLHRLVEFRNAIVHDNAKLSGLSEFRHQVRDPDVEDVHFAQIGEHFALEVGFAREVFKVAQRHLEYLMETYREMK